MEGEGLTPAVEISCPQVLDRKPRRMTDLEALLQERSARPVSAKPWPGSKTSWPSWTAYSYAKINVHLRKHAPVSSTYEDLALRNEHQRCLEAWRAKASLPPWRSPVPKYLTEKPSHDVLGGVDAGTIRPSGDCQTLAVVPPRIPERGLGTSPLL